MLKKNLKNFLIFTTVLACLSGFGRKSNATIQGSSSYQLVAQPILRVGLDHIFRLTNKPLMDKQVLETLMYYMISSDVAQMMTGFSPDFVKRISLTYINFKIDDDYYLNDVSRLLLSPHFDLFHPTPDLKKSINIDWARKKYLNTLRTIFVMIDGMERFHSVLRTKISFHDYGTTYKVIDGNGGGLGGILESLFGSDAVIDRNIARVIGAFPFISDATARIMASPKLEFVVRSLVHRHFQQMETPMNGQASYAEMEQHMGELDRKAEALIKKILSDEEMQKAWISRGIFLRSLTNSAKMQEIIVQQRLVLLHEIIDRQQSVLAQILTAPMGHLQFLNNLKCHFEFLLSITPEFPAGINPQDRSEFQNRLSLRELNTLVNSALKDKERIPSKEYDRKVETMFETIEGPIWYHYKAVLRGLNGNTDSDSNAMRTQAQIQLIELYQLIQKYKSRITIDTNSFPTDALVDVPVGAILDDEDAIKIVNGYFERIYYHFQDLFITPAFRRVEGRDTKASRGGTTNFLF